MKLIAQRRFEHDGTSYAYGQSVDVSEATGKELLAVGTLVYSAEAHAAAEKAKAAEKAPNINAGTDAGSLGSPESVNPPNRDPHKRKTKPANPVTETKPAKPADETK